MQAVAGCCSSAVVSRTPCSTSYAPPCLQRCWSLLHVPQRGRRAGCVRRSRVQLICAIGSGQLDTGIGLAPELKMAIDSFVQENKVVLFMKGTKDFPQCGFSNTCVQILNMLQTPFTTVNILEDERLRSGMKEYSQWPTFPQVYIDGEFYGGCDILIEAYQNGELQEELERVNNS